jgi:hypothetical protein
MPGSSSALSELRRREFIRRAAMGTRVSRPSPADSASGGDRCMQPRCEPPGLKADEPVTAD